MRFDILHAASECCPQRAPETRQEEAMWTRRQFGKTAAAASAAALFSPAVLRAAPIKMRVGLASGVNDAQVAFQSMGMHKRLEWYQKEGIDLEIINTGSTSQPLQLLSNNQVEFATIAPGTLIPPFADNPELPVSCAYTWMPRIHNRVNVKPDSPIRSIADLKGKTIGIRNSGDSGYFFLQAAFRELNIDPQKDVEWISVGAGGPAGQALYRDQVAALAIWDVELLRIEIAGFKTRELPNLPSAQALFGNSYAVNRNAFEKNKEAYAKTFRAIAKGQVFSAANPRASILLHWDLYPESKPKGKSEEEAMGEMIRIIEVRKDKWFPWPSSPDQRMGASTKDQWEASVAFIGRLNPKIQEKVKDVSRLYTMDILDAANQFDRKAMEAEAKAFKV
jgi:NitT/TauT family transport system substrate-binding protein